MIIYRCDACGKEHQKQGIVSSRFKDAGFQELSVSVDGVRDACRSCAKAILSAASEKKIDDRILSRVAAEETVAQIRAGEYVRKPHWLLRLFSWRRAAK